MFSLFNRLFNHRADVPVRSVRKPRRRVRLQVECLEQRQLMSSSPLSALRPLAAAPALTRTLAPEHPLGVTDAAALDAPAARAAPMPDLKVAQGTASEGMVSTTLVDDLDSLHDEGHDLLVANGDQFPDGKVFLVRIDNEVLSVYRSSELGGTNFYISQRGLNGTEAADHKAGALVTLVDDAAPDAGLPSNQTGVGAVTSGNQPGEDKSLVVVDGSVVGNRVLTGPTIGVPTRQVPIGIPAGVVKPGDLVYGISSKVENLPQWASQFKPEYTNSVTLGGQDLVNKIIQSGARTITVDNGTGGMDTYVPVPTDSAPLPPYLGGIAYDSLTVRDASTGKPVQVIDPNRVAGEFFPGAVAPQAGTPTPAPTTPTTPTNPTAPTSPASLDVPTPLGSPLPQAPAPDAANIPNAVPPTSPDNSPAPTQLAQVPKAPAGDSSVPSDASPNPVVPPPTTTTTTDKPTTPRKPGSSSLPPHKVGALIVGGLGTYITYTALAGQTIAFGPLVAGVGAVAFAWWLWNRDSAPALPRGPLDAFINKHKNRLKKLEQDQFRGLSREEAQEIGFELSQLTPQQRAEVLNELGVDSQRLADALKEYNASPDNQK